MTKTAIKMKELDEVERHNRATEGLGRASTLLSGVSNIANLFLKGGVKGAVLGTALSAILGAAGAKEYEQLQSRKQSGERLSKDEFAKYRQYEKKIRLAHSKGGKK